MGDRLQEEKSDPLKITISSQYTVFDQSGKLPFSIVFGLCRRKPTGDAHDSHTILLDTSGSVLDVPVALANGLLKLYRGREQLEVDLSSFTATAAEPRYISIPPRPERTHNTQSAEPYHCQIDAAGPLADFLQPGAWYSMRVKSEQFAVRWWAYGEPEEILMSDTKPAVPSEPTALVSRGRPTGRALFKVVPSLEWPPRVEVLPQIRLPKGAEAGVRFSICC